MGITTDIDMRNRLGPARFQAGRPTCMAFAASALHEVKRVDTEYLSVEFLFYSGANRSHRDPTRGLTEDAVKSALSLDGQPHEDVWPYLSPVEATKSWSPPKGIKVVHKTHLTF